MVKYNKLVRDKIPEIIQQKGGKCTIRIADEKEYWEKLRWKLREEMDEFLETQSEEELADLLEVIDAVIECKKFDRKKIELVKSKKVEERGRFEKRIILEEA